MLVNEEFLSSAVMQPVVAQPEWDSSRQQAASSTTQLTSTEWRSCYVEAVPRTSPRPGPAAQLCQVMCLCADRGAVRALGISGNDGLMAWLGSNRFTRREGPALSPLLVPLIHRALRRIAQPLPTGSDVRVPRRHQDGPRGREFSVNLATAWGSPIMEIAWRLTLSALGLAAERADVVTRSTDSLAQACRARQTFAEHLSSFMYEDGYTFPTTQTQLLGGMEVPGSDMAQPTSYVTLSPTSFLPSLHLLTSATE
jgi:hypothetical protein